MFTSKHINACGEDLFKVFPIYKMKNDNMSDRQEKGEFLFIKLLKLHLNVTV